MLVIFASIVIGYLFVQLAGYGIHRMLHSPMLGRLHRSHSYHHDVAHPVDGFLADSYRHPPGSDNPIWYYGPPIALSAILAFVLLPLYVSLVLTVELVAIAWLNDWLHVQVHVRGSWLERFPWFVRLREMHFRHHEDDGVNFGVFSWLGDRIGGTLDAPSGDGDRVQ